MSRHDRELAQRLEAGLQAFSKVKILPGINTAERRTAFIEQLIESVHRVEFVRLMRNRDISGRRADPSDSLFDPLKAAMLHQRDGNVEEAFWLVFLFVHFGKNPRGGWRYAREIYGRFGEGGQWDWQTTSKDPRGFRKWLHAHQAELTRAGVAGGFGNHRKYESLNALSANGTGNAVETYVKWVGPPRTHEELVSSALKEARGDPRKAFDILYRSMAAVSRFGRTARFDYLTMLGKLGLAAIEPGSTYMQGATGPVQGAELLLGAASKREFDAWLVQLDNVLHVGMQVLEDALCNWQKSPAKFKPFRG
jgi:hypothetical protein